MVIEVNYIDLVRLLDDQCLAVGGPTTYHEVLIYFDGPVVATGPAILAPITRWLSVPAAALAVKIEGDQRIGAGEVAAIEAATQYFARTDALTGGALSREAVVGQLKYAVDLAKHATYTIAVGNRLLAAVAELAGLVGWLCQDSDMPGPSQRYFTYGLQAARESTDPRAVLLVVSILSDMAQLSTTCRHRAISVWMN